MKQRVFYVKVTVEGERFPLSSTLAEELEYRLHETARPWSVIKVEPHYPPSPNIDMGGEW